jgi:stage II sporulation protein AA (anti-sigma F factor antagonist)
MQITVSDFGKVGTRVSLVGRLDVLGANTIELLLNELADSENNIVIDVAGVEFIASIGMRHLVMAARAAARNSRTLVLLNPTPLVANALTQAGLGHLLPMVNSDEEAQAALSRYAN